MDTKQPNVCQCGCGTQIPAISKKGRPQKFAHGHNRRGKIGKRIAPVRWLEEDRGYETPCWIWQLALSRGYGKVKMAGGRYRAHRYFWEQQYGSVPDGLELDHLCGQRDCVRPDHLEAVTHAVNCQRRRNKITAEDAQAIRVASLPVAVIAKRYGLSRVHVYRIKKGLVWQTTDSPSR